MGLFSCLSPEAFDVPCSDTLTNQTPSQPRTKIKKARGLRKEDNNSHSETCAHKVAPGRISPIGPVVLPPCHALSSTSLQTPNDAPSRKSQIGSLFSLSPSPSPSSLSLSRSSCSPRPVVVHLSMIGRECEWENEDKQPKRPSRPRLGRSLTAPPAAPTLDEKYICDPVSVSHQSSNPKGRKRSLSTASVSDLSNTRYRARNRKSESNSSSDCPDLDLANIAPASSLNDSLIVFQMDFDKPAPLVSSRPPSITSPTSTAIARPINTSSLIQNDTSRSRTISTAYQSYEYDHPDFDLPPLSTDLTITPDLVSLSSFKSSSSFYPSPESSPEILWDSMAQTDTQQTSPERRLAALAALIVDAPTPRTSFEAENSIQSKTQSERCLAESFSDHLNTSNEKDSALEPGLQSRESSTTKTIANKPRALIKNVNGLKAEWRKNREAATWGEELTWEFIKAVNEGR
ncbi:hypothetical protein [Phaffia rhodozyma]|uniref:Uncharacterized protein n=1 Tax=Phaffia rhodozyma TaxID=264483 RepID=A0A0F7SKQ4_PHARH|nr:hypothetical protein [Phaffia rhodozyma]